LNLGHLQTKGWEASLGWKDHIGKVSYRVGGTITDNNNILVSYNANSIIAQGFNGAVQGYPIGSYFGLQYAGRIQDQENIGCSRLLAPGNNISMPITTATLPGVRLGENMYKDINNDGKLTVPGDLQFLGRDDPRYTYALNVGADYAGFDFSIIFQGVGKENHLQGRQLESSVWIYIPGTNRFLDRTNVDPDQCQCLLSKSFYWPKWYYL
jgi:hypothetical protein